MKDNQQGPTVQHRELYSISVITYDGKESGKVYTYTNTLNTLSILYTQKHAMKSH